MHKWAEILERVNLDRKEICSCVDGERDRTLLQPRRSGQSNFGEYWKKIFGEDWREKVAMPEPFSHLVFKTSPFICY